MVKKYLTSDIKLKFWLKKVEKMFLSVPEKRLWKKFNCLNKDIDDSLPFIVFT